MKTGWWQLRDMVEFEEEEPALEEGFAGLAENWV